MGFDQVYYPGELEHIRTQKLLEEGIFVEDATWERLKALAKELGLDERLEIGQDA